MKTIIVKASNARPSAHYSVEERMRNGAVDVDIALEIEHADGKRELPCSDGEVTLFRDDANGGMGTCGKPRDVWASAKLLKAVDNLGSEKDASNVLSCVASIAAKQAVNDYRLGSSDFVEID